MFQHAAQRIVQTTDTIGIRGMLVHTISVAAKTFNLETAARLNRVCSVLTQAVRVVVGTSLNVHAVSPAAVSGQLRFLGSNRAYPVVSQDRYR